VGLDRADRLEECLEQEDPTAGETLFFETEALLEGEAGAEVSVLRAKGRSYYEHLKQLGLIYL
jgi:hypothetical protein